MNVELRRKVDRVISDFLSGSPLDAEALVRHLSDAKLRIVTEAQDEDETNRLVKRTLDAAQTEIEEMPVMRLIDPAKRETVSAITVADAIEALEHVWHGNE